MSGTAKMKIYLFMYQFLDKGFEVLYSNYLIDKYITKSLKNFDNKNFDFISKEVIKFNYKEKGII